MLENPNSDIVYLFTIMIARFYQNIHFMALPDDKVGKDYLYLGWAEVEHRQQGRQLGFEQLFNWNVAFAGYQV